MNTDDLGYLAERSVLFKLAQVGIRATPANFPGFDIICENGLKLEVKGARPHRQPTRYPRWSFSNYAKRRTALGSNVSKRVTDGPRNIGSDFFILVGFDYDSVPMRSFIVPSKLMDGRRSVTLYLKPKIITQKLVPFYDALDRWERLRGLYRLP